MATIARNRRLKPDAHFDLFMATLKSRPQLKQPRQASPPAEFVEKCAKEHRREGSGWRKQREMGRGGGSKASGAISTCYL